MVCGDIESSPGSDKRVLVIYSVNQNTLSALDEISTQLVCTFSALTNFDDTISIVNINEDTQLLFDRIDNAFKLFCPIRTKTLSPKNKNKP